jgi:hypothetical protein
LFGFETHLNDSIVVRIIPFGACFDQPYSSLTEYGTALVTYNTGKSGTFKSFGVFGAANGDPGAPPLETLKSSDVCDNLHEARKLPVYTGDLSTTPSNTFDANSIARFFSEILTSFKKSLGSNDQVDCMINSSAPEMLSNNSIYVTIYNYSITF